MRIEHCCMTPSCMWDDRGVRSGVECCEGAARTERGARSSSARYVHPNVSGAPHVSEVRFARVDGTAFGTHMPHLQLGMT